MHFQSETALAIIFAEGPFPLSQAYRILGDSPLLAHAADPTGTVLSSHTHANSYSERIAHSGSTSSPC